MPFPDIKNYLYLRCDLRILVYCTFEFEVQINIDRERDTEREKEKRGWWCVCLCVRTLSIHLLCYGAPWEIFSLDDQTSFSRIKGEKRGRLEDHLHGLSSSL